MLFHIDIHTLFHIGTGREVFLQRFHLCIRSIFIQNKHTVIKLDLAVLEQHDIHDGIPESKAHQKKRHTAADSENRHEKTLFITEKVPHRGFPAEA